MLVIRNALYVPEMKNNLIPPFIIREAGMQVLDTPKIHTKDPMVDAHSLYFEETNFRIPLQLWGVFSYFNMSKPSTKTMVECDEVYLLTLKSWDPHTDVHECNEREILSRSVHPSIFLCAVGQRPFLTYDTCRFLWLTN